MSEWKEYKLGELTIDGKGSYGIAAPAVDFNSDKYTYLRITDINDDGTLNKNGLKSVDDKNSHKYLLRQNDIVFARTGASVGRSYFYDERDGELVYAGFLIKYSIDPTKVNPKILKFYTHSQAYYDWIQTVDNGATRGNINAQTYASMPIILPERQEQDRIASILSSLDDKIDLLHRENATLEQMAETLFRQWFVVEAKEEWEDVLLGNLIDIGSGKGLQRFDFVENGLYSVLGANGDIGKTNKYLVDESNRVIYTGRVGTLGNVFRLENKKAWLSDNTLVIKPKEYYNFVYFVLKLSRLQDYNVGSTQPLIRQSDIKEIELVLPDRGILNAFEKECDLIYEKVENNNKQIQTLIQMRDGLLPRLMGGEVKI